MKNVARAGVIWIAAFAAAYVSMILLNSVGGMVHGQSMTYGSSRLYQEVSELSKLMVHLVPAIAVGYFAPALGWRIALAGSIVVELIGASGKFSHDGMPYVGDPLATALSLVLIGVLSAYWMASRQAKA